MGPDHLSRDPDVFVLIRLLSCHQWRNVACWRPPAEKAPPCWRPLPFWCPSLKLNKLGDFREYAGKISKKVCI